MDERDPGEYRGTHRRDEAEPFDPDEAWQDFNTWFEATYGEER